MALMSPHNLDERYDDALTRVALAGGLAALPQLGDLLGDGRMRSLVRAVERHTLGRRRPLPGASPTKALELSAGTVERLLDRRGGKTKPSEVGMIRCVQRFAWHLREGRPLLSPSWCATQVVEHGIHRLRVQLKRQRVLVQRLRDQGAAAEMERAYAHWHQLKAAYDRLTRPEAADDWVAATRVHGLYADVGPDPKAGPPQLAFIDREAAPSTWRRVFKAVSTVAIDLGCTLRLHALTTSPYQASLVRRVIERTLDAGGEGIVPQRIDLEVVDLGTARFFIHPVELPAVLTHVDRARLERIQAQFGGASDG